MSVLHICNTFFELELEEFSPRSLIQWLRTHPMFLQLQFLPLLYTGPDDAILVSDLPPDPDPRLCLLDSPHIAPLQDWGPSQAVAIWAEQKKIPYKIPPLDLIRQINGKMFSFLSSPQLPHSALLFDESEVHSWIEKTPGPKVLKTAYGTAGKGHFHVGQHSHLPAFLKKQFDQNLPVIGEPWVERLSDFSTQWQLTDQIAFIGATRFENTPKGQYLATFAGEKLSGWALEEHLAIAKPLLETLLRRGYFGHVGIDAFVYRINGKEKVHPIVEINGRKTMSWAALQIQQKKYPGQTIRLSYSKGCKGSLPSFLNLRGKKISFPYQIQITPIR